MGNSGGPRPGYDRWVSFPGHGSIVDPILNIDGDERQHRGYITDLLNAHAIGFLKQRRDRPFALFFAHKAVHPDAFQAADGTIDLSKGGYRPASRHADLYKGKTFPRRPNAQAPEVVVKQKPAWTEAFKLRDNEASRKVLDGIQAGSDEEIRLRAAMMASVDEGMGEAFAVLEETGQLDNTFILFLGDNGYFFGEHGLGPERRFAYEEGIKSPFLVRYPSWFKPGTINDDLVLALDIAPTVLDLAGAKASDREHIQGLSLRPLSKKGSRRGWRNSFMCEYFSENAMPWLIGMSYKAIRTRRHKYIHWTQKSLDGVECDELYDLKSDPFEMNNLLGKRGSAPLVTKLRRQLAQLVSHSVGL
jgi:N-acetylglucosamine-6-sulfatase